MGATLNEYFNKGIKYQARVEPEAFRIYHNLVVTTQSLFNQENQKLEKLKSKLFGQGVNAQWKIKEDGGFDLAKQYDRDYCY